MSQRAQRSAVDKSRKFNTGDMVLVDRRNLTVTALIFGFDDSTLSQRLLINVLLKSCISVLFMIFVELVPIWLGSLCKDSPNFY